MACIITDTGGGVGGGGDFPATAHPICYVPPLTLSCSGPREGGGEGGGKNYSDRADLNYWELSRYSSNKNQICIFPKVIAKLDYGKICLLDITCCHGYRIFDAMFGLANLVKFGE